MIQILITDLGNVLLPFDPEPGWKELLEAHPECAEYRKTFQRLFAEAELGKGLTDPEEFYRRLVHETGSSLPFGEFCRIWSDMFTEDDETVALIENAPVRERNLLSNTNAIHWDWILEKHGRVLKNLDRLWVSHEMGLEKPDPAIYQRVIETTGLPPEAHVFIDDLVENVEAAESLGIVGILHTDAAALKESFGKLSLLREE